MSAFSDFLSDLTPEERGAVERQLMDCDDEAERQFVERFLTDGVEREPAVPGEHRETEEAFYDLEDTIRRARNIYRGDCDLFPDRQFRGLKARRGVKGRPWGIDIQYDNAHISDGNGYVFAGHSWDTE